MKKLFVLLVSLPFIVVAQSEFTGEFRIDLTNPGSSWNVTFTLTAISARWDENLGLTDEYEIVSDNIHSTYPSETSAYFDHILDPGENPEFAIGLYKVSAIESGVEKACFYMDWRTSTEGWTESVDVYFKYDYSNKHFRNAANTQIIDHSYQTLWYLTSNILETSALEDYWDNCLAVFNNGNDHPKFAWGPYPGFSNNYYKIFKKKGTPDFVLYDSTTSTTYLDANEEILTGLPQANEGHIYYKITSVGYPTENPLLPPYESGYSNTADIRSLMPPLEKQGINTTAKNDYNLLQNYPNPFNPTTTITFNIPQSEKVTITVFDILGREVAELVNEQKETGTHTIKFDASNLTSGIYLYQIKAGDYSATRKLIFTEVNLINERLP
ncbi:MAG: T9SS type A sorting domain-containing protein [Ignavibacterium sp.]|nr:T9SS type A sorting domain-containing protein [Ignavibacterium sp.]